MSTSLFLCVSIVVLQINSSVIYIYIYIFIQYFSLFLTYFTLNNRHASSTSLELSQMSSFLLLSILHCIYVPYFFIHSSINKHLGCFHVLTIVITAAMNIEVQVSSSIRVSSGYMPSSKTFGLGSYGSFIPSFLRNPYIVLHSGCISLHSHQQSKRFLFLHTLSSIYCW